MPPELAPRSETLDGLPVGSAERVLRQASSWLLPGAPEIDRLADDAQADLLVGLAGATRLLGPLLAAVDAGALTLPGAALERAAAGHEDSMLWCLVLEVRLLEVAEWFHEAGGVDHLVVKGPAVAHLDEVEPSLRSFADIDLLIRGSDMDRAVATLEAHGVVRRVPQVRPGYDRRFIKSVGMKGPDEVEVDVHRTLCVGAPGLRIPLDDVFDRREHFELGGQRFGAPCRVHRALHAAYHAMIGTPEPDLRTLRDLAAHLTNPDLPPEVLVAEAARWRGETVLAEAVRHTFAELSFAAPAWSGWLEAFVPDPEELAIIASTQHETAWPVEWSTIRELAWPDRAAFLWALAFPSAEELASRGLTRRGRVIEGAKHVAPELRARLARR